MGKFLLYFLNLDDLLIPDSCYSVYPYIPFFFPSFFIIFLRLQLIPQYKIKYHLHNSMLYKNEAEFTIFSKGNKFQVVKQQQMGNYCLKQDRSNSTLHENPRIGSISVYQKVNESPATPSPSATSNQIRKQQPTLVMQFSRIVSSQIVVQQWLKDVRRIDSRQARATILLPLQHQFRKNSLCGDSGDVKLIYRAFQFSLEYEIRNRRSLQRFFDQTQIWFILFNLIRAGQVFEKIGKKIGNVNLQNTLINSQGMIITFSKISAPNQQDNFQSLVQDKNAKVYLAPEQLSQQNLRLGQYPQNIDQSLAQVFSIGLTVLSSGILLDCIEIYRDTSPRKIDQLKLRECLQVFGENYSVYLYETVSGMLALDPHNRRRCSQVYRQLRPYGQKILDLQFFSINSASNGR